MHSVTSIAAAFGTILEVIGFIGFIVALIAWSGGPVD